MVWGQCCLMNFLSAGSCLLVLCLMARILAIDSIQQKRQWKGKHTQLPKENEEIMSPRCNSILLDLTYLGGILLPPWLKMPVVAKMQTTTWEWTTQVQKGREEVQRSGLFRHFTWCCLKKGLLIFHLAIYDPIWLQLLKCPMDTWLRLVQSKWIQLCLLPFNQP